jgi:Beta-lactamase
MSISRKDLFGCDSRVATTISIADRSVIFSKKSDRLPDECQQLSDYPSRDWEKGATVRGGAGAMKRRTFLGVALACAAAPPLFAALRGKRWDDAAEVLERVTTGKQVDAAVLHVVQRGESFTRHFGKAASGDAMFLLGSISKPINVTAVMTLFDCGKFQLHDRVKKFLPAFMGGGRDEVTIRHLLTHTSGLPAPSSSSWRDSRKIPTTWRLGPIARRCTRTPWRQVAWVSGSASSRGRQRNCSTAPEFSHRGEGGATRRWT